MGDDGTALSALDRLGRASGLQEGRGDEEAGEYEAEERERRRSRFV